MKIVQGARDHTVRIPLVSGATAAVTSPLVEVNGRPFTIYIEGGSSSGASLRLKGSWNGINKALITPAPLALNVAIRWPLRAHCGWPFIVIDLLSITSGQLGNVYLIASRYLIS